MAALRADSADPEQLTHAVDQIAKQLRGIDIFVSSAGALLFKDIAEFTPADFDEIVSFDLRAAFVGRLPISRPAAIGVRFRRRMSGIGLEADGLLLGAEGGIAAVAGQAGASDRYRPNNVHSPAPKAAPEAHVVYHSARLAFAS